MSESRPLNKLVVLVLLLLLLGVLGSWWKKRGVPSVHPSAYQTVYLANGQQYFGHLKNLWTRHPYLTDVYYVQTQGNTQNFTLLKFGNEIHGPEDVLYLNWKNVLYWENLKSDSKIVEAIAQEKAQRTQ